MSVESVKRVLLKIKAAAREMRKGRAQERLNPKPPEEKPAAPAESAAAGDELGAPAETKSGDDAALARQLLAQV